jgi:hypothetical protein
VDDESRDGASVVVARTALRVTSSGASSSESDIVVVVVCVCVVRWGVLVMETRDFFFHLPLIKSVRDSARQRFRVLGGKYFH